jgi:hypothetical protein
MNKQQNKKNNEKVVMKFDSGRGGFEYMIGVLAVCAILVLVLGIYFITKIL